MQISSDFPSHTQYWKDALPLVLLELGVGRNRILCVSERKRGLHCVTAWTTSHWPSFQYCHSPTPPLSVVKTARPMMSAAKEKVESGSETTLLFTNKEGKKPGFFDSGGR